MNELSIFLLIIVFLIVCSAFFSSSETALTAVSEARINELVNKGNKKAKLIENFFLSEKQANSVLDMPLKKLTTLEKNQIDNEIKNLKEKKNYFQKLLNERELLLKLLIEELLILKKNYNVIRKTKIIKDINQNEELETLNNQILEDFINKKTKLYIDNRLYLKKMILGNYKKSFEVVNKIIDNKNIQKFICNIEKNIKLTLFLESIMTTYGVQKCFIGRNIRLKICKNFY